jgi:hypothetical protein
VSDSGSVPHDQLPLPDYDHLPVGSLEGRIRSLDAERGGAGLSAGAAERTHPRGAGRSRRHP